MKLGKRTNSGRTYAVIGLAAFGQQFTRYVHRLVAAAFIGPCPEGHHVHHIDNDPSNNFIENLRYVTPAEHIKCKSHKPIWNKTRIQHDFSTGPAKWRGYTYEQGRFECGLLRSKRGTVVARFPFFKEGLTVLGIEEAPHV